MKYQVTNEEIKQLVEVLVHLGEFRRPTSRYDVVESWFNDSPRQQHLIMILDLEGAPHVAARRLVQKLLEFGQDYEGHEVLVWLVEGVLASPELRVEKRPFLEQLATGLTNTKTTNTTPHVELSNHAVLRETMTMALGLTDLQNIAFDMGIDYETLEGQQKDGKIRALITLTQRHKRIDELLHQCEKINPHVSWR